jgi:glyoxylase-like metal-dependent hydrolase (beta-lactamase superfamily II)
MMDFDKEIAKTFPIGKAIDIFGDQTVWAISTPGHSKGHISYLVNTEDRPVLIAGDACILNKSLEIGAGPGTSSADIELAQKTLDKICTFVRNNTYVEVWCGQRFDFHLSMVPLY